MIREWLELYKPQTPEKAEQALREILQEIALAGLHRSGFFQKAAFYGGTALRIFHELPRFSEDLDFSLLEINPEFSLDPYLKIMTEEFRALGITISVKEKVKNIHSNVDSAFLKSGTEWKELILRDIIPQEQLKNRPEIKIKLEVDNRPPPGFTTEEKLLLRPYSFYTKCYALPDLFAGKMHAVLFRKWKTRVKGRDWFDFEWFIKRGIPLNLAHFAARAFDSRDWARPDITMEEFTKLLNDKIAKVSFKNIKDDITRFIPDDSILDIWSAAYFKELTERIKFI